MSEPESRPTLPSTRSAVSGRMVALEARVVALETRVHELYHWIVVILGLFIASVLLALGYAVRSYFKS